MFKNILVPLDLGDETESVYLFTAAAELAEPMGATLHVMTVVPEFAMPMVASFFPADYEEKAMVEGRNGLAAFVAAQEAKDMVSEQIVGHGSVYKEVVKAANKSKCDVIVLGSGSADTGDFLLGHNAARVMRHADCSVILLRK